MLCAKNSKLAYSIIRVVYQYYIIKKQEHRTRVLCCF
jgi:hypothetical protein